MIGERYWSNEKDKICWTSLDLHSTLILKFNVWFFNAFRTLLYNLLLFPNDDDDDDDDGWGVAVALAANDALLLLFNEIWILGALLLLLLFNDDDDDDMIVVVVVVVALYWLPCFLLMYYVFWDFWGYDSDNGYIFSQEC